jgi:hypothetical protein
MKRKLIIIGYPGEKGNDNYLLGVSSDVDRYKNFFKSNYGGAWEDEEIIQYGNLHGLSAFSLMPKTERFDYVVIVFSGHGGALRDGTPIFQCGQDLISAENFRDRFKSEKMLIIADSCLCSIEENISKVDINYNLIDESVSRSRKEYRV